MSIANSSLFKDYARPILKPEHGRERSSSWTFGLFDSITDIMYRRRRLSRYDFEFETSRLAISEATQESFCLAVAGEIIKTRVWSQTIGPAIAPILWGDEVIGNIQVPEIELYHRSTAVELEKQRIEVTNVGAYQQFLQSLVQDHQTPIRISLAEFPVESLGRSTRHQDCQLFLSLPAMGGPQLEVLKPMRNGNNIEIRILLRNQSSIEMEHGGCVFDLRNDRNDTIAVMTGTFDIVKGDNKYVLHGSLLEGAKITTTTRLVGIGLVGPEAQFLPSQSITQIDVVMLQKKDP